MYRVGNVLLCRRGGARYPYCQKMHESDFVGSEKENMPEGKLLEQH